MGADVVTYGGGPIFDGEVLQHGVVARFEGGQLVSILPEGEAARAAHHVDLRGDILSPGYVDLQVNGGGGVLFNDAPSVVTLERIAAAHRQLGATTILPTLITDTAAKTQAAIAATVDAIEAGVPGIAGVHLEGPHLSVARKGAHDGALIREMTEGDLAALIAAAEAMPVLKVTVAPENVTRTQVAALAEAGVIVALGHTDADFDTAMAYAEAGACCVTHLFNAMSQMGSRTPGVVGAALTHGGLSAGLIADGVHVHPATIRAAWQAKAGPGQIYLVSDAMAVAGTDLGAFELGGRRICRQDGRLTLEDGTLAGADLELTTALRVLGEALGVAPESLLAHATSVPAGVIGLAPTKALSQMIRIVADFSSVRPLV